MSVTKRQVHACLKLVSFFLLFCVVAIAWVGYEIQTTGRYKDYGGDHYFEIKNGLYYLQKNNHYAKSKILSELEGSQDIIYFDYQQHGPQINPVHTAQYILSAIIFAGEPEIDRVIQRNLEYLIEEYAQAEKNELYYPYNFDFPRHNQESPWFSSMAQGQVASALIRGWRAYGFYSYYSAAIASIRPFFSSEKGLVKYIEDGIWLQEYPGDRCQVLDGTLAAIAGIYDVYQETINIQDKEALRALLDSSLRGVKSNSNLFNSPKGHYFDECGRVPSDGYYKVNIQFINYLMRYDPEFMSIKEMYISSPLTFFERIILRFLDLKNKAIDLLVGRKSSKVS